MFRLLILSCFLWMVVSMSVHFSKLLLCCLSLTSTSTTQRLLWEWSGGLYLISVLIVSAVFLYVCSLHAQTGVSSGLCHSLHKIGDLLVHFSSHRNSHHILHLPGSTFPQFLWLDRQVSLQVLASLCCCTVPLNWAAFVMKWQERTEREKK